MEGGKFPGERNCGEGDSVNAAKLKLKIKNKLKIFPVKLPIGVPGHVT